MLVQVLTAGGELLRRGVLEVPQLVLHSGAELVWVPFSFRVELHADCCILKESHLKFKYFSRLVVGRPPAPLHEGTGRHSEVLVGRRSSYEPGDPYTPPAVNPSG